jgi:general secretion pathway protein M
LIVGYSGIEQIMFETFLKNWQQLQPRERLILGWGGPLIMVILSYGLVLQPWHAALDHMEKALPFKRADLVWMRQQAELLKQGGATSGQKFKGENQSLMSVVEQTAKASGVRNAIQQMVPAANNQEVSVVLEEVSFNNWVRWVDTLQNQYGVAIKQLTADREDEQADQAEIRLTFIRQAKLEKVR